MNASQKTLWSIAVFFIGAIIIGIFRETIGAGSYLLTGILVTILFSIWSSGGKEQASLREDVENTLNQTDAIPVRTCTEKSGIDARDIIRQIKDGSVSGFQTNHMWYVNDQKFLNKFDLLPCKKFADSKLEKNVNTASDNPEVQTLKARVDELEEENKVLRRMYAQEQARVETLKKAVEDL